MNNPIEVIETENKMICGDIAVHCDKCGGIFPIPSEDFKNYYTGMFLRLQDKFVLHCPSCNYSLSLLFIPSEQKEDVESNKVSEESVSE